MRRCLWGGGAAATLSAGTLAYARYVEPFWPKMEYVSLSLPAMNPALAGLRIAQLSDLHLADEESLRYLRRELARCTSTKPDLILLTGDYVTCGDTTWTATLPSLMSELSAPFGVLAVLGNHDYSVYRTSGGRSSPQLRHADNIAAALARSGVRVLRNESVVLTIRGCPLQIIGIDDLWSGRFDPEQSFARVDPSLPSVALAHNPDTVDLILDKPWHWLLCGHTHGGQVSFPLIGAPLVPVKNKKYTKGLIRFGDKMMYVNRGLGYLRPLRLNCRPEITYFDLEGR